MCCSVLQCVVVCCSVRKMWHHYLWRTRLVCCNVWQCVAMHKKRIATIHAELDWCVAVCCGVRVRTRIPGHVQRCSLPRPQSVSCKCRWMKMCCRVLQYVAVCSNVCADMSSRPLYDICIYIYICVYMRVCLQLLAASVGVALEWVDWNHFETTD